MCQVLASFITPLATFWASPLSVPEEGLKGLRHQLVATPEQKKTAGVNRVGLRAEQRTIFPAIERCVVERVVRRLGRIVVKRDIEEMLAVGKEKRPAMRGVQSRVELRNRNWSSAAGADAHERRCGSRERTGSLHPVPRRRRDRAVRRKLSASSRLRGRSSFSLPSAKNPRERLSGDQKGKIAPSVPGSACASSEFMGRTQSAVLPSAPVAANAMDAPSGESTGGPAESPVRLNVVFSGGSMTVRMERAD